MYSFLPACGLSSIILLGWTFLRGQDANWDLQNYHLYDVFALLHGRLHADVAPGGPQSFLNPLPYVLPYLARRLLSPVGAGLAIAASQLIPIMIIWGIARRVWGSRPGGEWVAVISMVCACTGAIVLTEAGTSFCDVVLSALPLFGLLLLLPSGEDDQAPRTVHLLMAGIAVGAAVALKPTGLFLLPALACSAVLTANHRLSGSVLFRVACVPALGAIAGAVLSDGAWAVLLWTEYGSPVFPFLNRLFQAPSAASIDFADPRYHWQSIPHAIALPLNLAVGSDEAGEIVVRDIRFALALPVSLAIMLLRPVLARAGRPRDPLLIPNVWFLVGTAFWLLLSPLQRYAVSLEMLASVIITVVAARLAGRWRFPILMGVVIVLAMTTRPADFFHRPWSDAYTPHVPSAISAGATYGLLDQPLAYWVTAAPHPAHAFMLLSDLLTPGGRLQRRLDRIVGGAGHKLWLLDLDRPVGRMIRTEMSMHGIVMAPPCIRAGNMVWIDTVFCGGRLVGARADAASDLPMGEQVRFSKKGTGLIYEIFGWDATEQDGTWATAPHAVLAFRPVSDPSGGVMMLTLKLAGINGAPAHHVVAQANGGASQDWTIDATGPTTRKLCIGHERKPGDVVEVQFDTDDVRSLRKLGSGLEARPLAFRLLFMRLSQAETGECGRLGVSHTP